MENYLKAVPITEKVWWVGAIDWNLREFHGYRTSRGTTYNAYLVLADKITLIDTVKAPFREEMRQRIASVIGDPARIGFIISNHAEMDHSSALPEVIAAVKPEKVFASAAGVKALDAHFGIGPALTPVKTGDTISLGNMAVNFIETPMLHWPDSMMTYLSEEKVLFTQDGFGMHLATDALFAEENDAAVLEQEMRKYFANILLPYAPRALKLLDEAPKLNLPFEVIAPDHGPVWRGELLKMPLERYRTWAAQRPANRALVMYSTMWRSTEKMAVAIGDGLRAAGTRVTVMSLQAHSRSEAATEMLCAGALIAGSPTINNQMFPEMADALCYLKGLRPKNLLSAAFGSFGWSGEATAKIAREFADMKLEMAAEPLKVKYVPTDADLKNCFDYGQRIGQLLAEKTR